MIVPLTQFAAEGSGIGALGIDGKAFVIQLVSFLLAFWVLKRWAFGPIVRLMTERQKTINEGVTLSETMKRQKTELDARVAKELHEARQKADGIVAEAQDVARDTTRAAEDKAQAKAAIIVKEGQARGAQEVARARKALETELVGIISDATEAIIDEKVDAKKDAQLIETALKAQRSA